jgi:tripartite-type tricarboxylate transporter receptor subunit TctC
VIVFKFLALLFLALPAMAQEIITVYSPYSAGHGGNVAFQKVLERANAQQKKYLFVMELKPGAQGVIALTTMNEHPQSRLAIIHAAFVDNLEAGLIKEEDYRPVHSIGDACWAVLSSTATRSGDLASIKGTGEITVGTVGFGNVSHLTALAIAEKYGLSSRLIVFKSNYDAVVNMAGNNGINFGIERISVVKQFEKLNPKLKAIAMSCPTRYSADPKLKTLKEQGIDVPSVFNIVMANHAMSQEKITAIGKVLDQATLSVGLKEIQQLSDMRSSVFDKVSVQDFYSQRISEIQYLRNKYRKQINDAKGNP